PVARHQPTTQDQAVQNQSRSNPLVMSDKINQISNTLENTTADHQNNFTAVLGQNVLKTTPDSHYDHKFRNDYHHDGGV
ncbi:hypothetical protein RA275_29860, partial [Pseudomonas syringae pv. tagetis]